MKKKWMFHIGLVESEKPVYRSIVDEASISFQTCLFIEFQFMYPLNGAYTLFLFADRCRSPTRDRWLILLLEFTGQLPTLLLPSSLSSSTTMSYPMLLCLCQSKNMHSHTHSPDVNIDSRLKCCLRTTASMVCLSVITNSSFPPISKVVNRAHILQCHSHLYNICI